MAASSDLTQRVAVVTGASRGIGAATARLLAARGAKVALAARGAEALNAVAEAIRGAGGEALAVPTDVADPQSVAALFASVRDALGPVDVLVNNAATIAVGPLHQLEPDAWERQLRVNVTGPYLCAREALTDMRARRRGVIVNVGSVAGVPGVEKLPGLVAYATTKGAVLTFTEALAAELEPEGVRVVCVSPGSTATEMLEAVAPPEVVAAAMDPSRVAEVIAFLASDAGAGVNKTNVTVWGGPPNPA
jgi:NAD(P)-dependent dehydrogenase (short-subunit alcohol dehydrogenase family)